MKHIECKLTFSWSENNICTITDAMCGKSLQIDIAQHICTGELDREIALTVLNNLIEVLNTSAEQKVWLLKNPTDYRDGIIIRDIGHFAWDIVEDGKYANIKENKITMNSSFDKRKVLSVMYSTVSLLNSVTKRLHPKTDIVRRVADCKLLVWVYDGHCVAVAEKNVDGLAMSNALIDGDFYPALLVDVSRENDLCSIYDISDGSMVFCCPLDDSVTTYYKPSEEII